MVNPDPWVVHKFGGSSVADADCFRKVAAIIESAPAGRLGVVLSACKGVTDALLRLVALAERQDQAYRDELAELHRDTLDPLLRENAIGPRPTSDYQHLLVPEDSRDETPSEEKPTNEPDTDSGPKSA